jgi:hypothetical protein
MSDTAPCRGLCGRLLPRSGRNVYAIDGTYPFCAPCARERGLAVPDLAVAAAPKPTMPFAELAAADESSPEPDPEPELEPEDVDPTTLLVTGALIVCNQTRIRVEAADDVSWRITLVTTPWEIPVEWRMDTAYRSPALRFRHTFESYDEAIRAARRVARVLDRLAQRLDTAVTEAKALLGGLTDEIVPTPAAPSPVIPLRPLGAPIVTTISNGVPRTTEAT